MKLKAANSNQAMTLIEVLVVVVVLMLLAAMLRPQLAINKRSPMRINCVNNLKQIGIAFKTWAVDNHDKFPMQVSVTNGGTMEIISSGTVFPHFLVMSNELSDPKLLVCPADKSRKAAASFGSDFRDKNVSYFLGVDATEEVPSNLLAGDRNLSLNDAAVNPGLISFPSNSLIGWTTELHNKQGNILCSDGSVQQVSGAKFQQALQNTGFTTNRLAIP